MIDINNLIKELEKRFPDKFPRGVTDSYELGEISGNITVIEFIKNFRDKKLKKG